MVTKTRANLAGYVALVLGFGFGCGGRADAGVGDAPPYEEDTTVLFTPDGQETVRTPNGEQCLDRPSDSCIAPQDVCGDQGTADVIVDADGNVLDVVCYGQDVTVDSVPIDQVDTASAGNDTVLVIDGKDDGDDVTGDVVLEGNNAVVWGEGPDVSVIGGSLDIQMNNAVVRGVRIRGDVTIDKNNTQLLSCVIEGNLTVLQNNTTIAGCEVYGTVTIGQNNTVLVGNRFDGVDVVEAANATCSGNRRIDDANGNLTIDDGELGGDVTCQ